MSLKIRMAVIAALAVCLSGCGKTGEVVQENAVPSTSQAAHEEVSGEAQEVTVPEQVISMEVAEAEDFTDTDPLKKYTDPAELCADYLEEYVTSVFTGSDFDIRQYSTDSKLVEYTSQKHEFERRYHTKGGFGTLHDLDIHTDEIFQDETDGVLWLTVPYEVSYGQDSAYGIIAYFEAVRNEDGFYELSMALDKGYGDSYLLDVQIHRKGSSPPLDIDLDAGIEAARKSNEWNDVIQSEIAELY